MSAGDSSAVFFDDDIVGFGFGFIGLEVSALEGEEARADTMETLNWLSLTTEIGSDCQLVVT